MSQKYNIQKIESSLKSFLEKETKSVIASRDTDLVKKGIISSLDMFLLIEFIEKKFKVSVDITTLNPENFNSLRSIAAHIALWTSI
ncbi:hypothetical protein BK004_01425 [bacterium CG10_46_32]|nr:MAG: hypothetical protein BK004_01425 [bacterium CG10_46_32]PIR56358.1 MAG: hypothetical protein COU73_01440 [Parcubacteria group bacterium CG10_big_fil_rev_8_21_14_0_10_46_32]